jgi:hypothetical protein
MYLLMTDEMQLATLGIYILLMILKMYRAIKFPDDCNLLQSDINSIEGRCKQQRNLKSYFKIYFEIGGPRTRCQGMLSLG